MLSAEKLSIVSVLFLFVLVATQVACHLWIFATCAVKKLIKLQVIVQYTAVK